MNDVSPRRRLLGRALLVGAIVALPLTASISYAENLAAPEAPPAPAAPLAPAAPAVAGTVPAPPAPPAPPLALALQASGDVTEDEEEVVIVRKVVEEGEPHDGEKKVKKIERRVIHKDGHKLSAEERARLMAEVRESLKDAEGDIAEAHKDMRVAMLELDNAHGMTKVKIKCRSGDEGTELRDRDGKTVTRLCTSDVMASALEGLKEARAEIAKSKEMDAAMRAEVLAALDAKIAEWKQRR